ncbi:hypothetical protein R3P38DRAFT_3180009 [Favolaschia claudopus]|uniref:Neuromedin U C-terminal domain-containing protein n=1 Tax=Favolaschia claudopus TaxID=2862362 RepID=A0AAW0CTS3_9AGAR
MTIPFLCPPQTEPIPDGAGLSALNIMSRVDEGLLPFVNVGGQFLFRPRNGYIGADLAERTDLPPQILPKIIIPHNLDDSLRGLDLFGFTASTRNRQ